MERILHSGVLCACCFSAPASADWVQLGAALRCDQEQFELSATATTSDPAYDVLPAEGFEALPIGADQQHVCALEGIELKLRIDVHGPQARGQGQGAGVLVLRSLRINQVEQLPHPLNFNWQVMSERVLTRIALSRAAESSEASSYRLDLCESKGFDWRSAYSDETCASVSIEAGESPDSDIDTDR